MKGHGVYKKETDEEVEACCVTLVVAFMVSALIAWLLEFLWNWLVPLLFHGGPSVTYWEAFGLIGLLCIVSGYFKSTGRGV